MRISARIITSCEVNMIKAVIFDMFETLITHYDSPLYFCVHIARELGVPHAVFNETWKSAETERMTGKLTLEELLKTVLEANNAYSEERLHEITRKRLEAKEEVFRHIHKDIVPMLEELKRRGVLIGLVSNCYSEEVELIKSSVLYPYFDKACLSYEEGCLKPDRRIFERCLSSLGVSGDECIYIGDGGSSELEAASSLSMKAFQAVWYLEKHGYVPTPRNKKFEVLHSPADILGYI